LTGRWEWLFAAFVIFDGKATSKHLLQHLLIGAALGFVLGFLFSRNQEAKTQNGSIVVKRFNKPCGMKEIGRGGGDRNGIPTLLSLIDGRRYQPHSNPIVRNVRKRVMSIEAA
jgi:hypothetical protein